MHMKIARAGDDWTCAEVSLTTSLGEDLLTTKVLPGLRAIEGYRGGYVLRCDGSKECEFVVINLFDSLAPVRAFAGADYSTPVFEPEARALLSRIEPIARHYEVRANTL